MAHAPHGPAANLGRVGRFELRAEIGRSAIADEPTPPIPIPIPIPMNPSTNLDASVPPAREDAAVVIDAGADQASVRPPRTDRTTVDNPASMEQPLETGELDMRAFGRAVTSPCWQEYKRLHPETGALTATFTLRVAASGRVESIRTYQPRDAPELLRCIETRGSRFRFARAALERTENHAMLFRP